MTLAVWPEFHSQVVCMGLVLLEEVVMPHHPLPKVRISASLRGTQQLAGCCAMADSKLWIFGLEMAENPIASESW